MTLAEAAVKPPDQFWVDCGKQFVSKYLNREALFCFQKIEDGPVRVFNTVQSLREVDKALALHHAREQVRCFPDSALVWSALAVAEMENYLWDDAIRHFQVAISKDDRLSQPWADIAYCYQMVNQYEDAARAYEQAIMSDLGRVELRTWYAMTKMALRDWDTGLAHYDARLMHANPLPRGSAIWTGESLEGKTICLFQEQGHGDLVQFIRYVKVLRERFHARKILLVCRDVAYRLMRLVDGIDEIYTPDMILPLYDYHVALMSIPGIIRRTCKDCPRMEEYFWSNYGPYIRAAGLRLARDAGRTIGVCWRGNGAHQKDHLRSLGLDYAKALMASLAQHGRLVSLQFDMTPEEGAAFYGMERPEFGDLRRLAEIISAVDLVVSVDTLIVHLAGAIGKRCHVLLQNDADWRWGLDGATTCWYDSLRLHRAKRPFEWGPVISEVAEAVG